MMERNNKHISVRRQCELLDVNRGRLYYSASAINNEENLRIMNLIDGEFTEPPSEIYLEGRDSLCSASVAPSLRKAKESEELLQLTPNTKENLVLTMGRGIIFMVCDIVFCCAKFSNTAAFCSNLQIKLTSPSQRTHRFSKISNRGSDR